MIKIHDNLFDNKFINDLAYIMVEEIGWKANNTAGPRRWPYGNAGPHRLLGENIFLNYNWTDPYKNSSFIDMHIHPNKKLVSDFFSAFEHICASTNNDLILNGISLNLQFMGMDGSWHNDGNDKQVAFILMVAYDEIRDGMGGGFAHRPSDTVVDFKNGRLIEMTASDEHKGLSFNVPDIPRFTIKWCGIKKGPWLKG